MGELGQGEPQLACPLCRSSQRHFFCCSCFRGGDFAIFRSERTDKVRRGCSPLTPQSPYLGRAPALVRFADVQLQYLTRRAEAEEVQAECEKLLEGERRERFVPEAESRILEQRLADLKACILGKTTSLHEKSDRRAVLAKEVEELRTRLKAARCDGKNWELTLSRVTSRKRASEERLRKFRQRLSVEQNRRIRDVLTIVFPITEKVEDGEGEASVVESQLFEALNLTYFQGSWVDLGTPSATPEHQIVAPFLPKVVDSPAFLALLSGAGGGDDGGEKRISSNCALFFANQTVQVLARIVGVRLPAPVPLSSFVSPDESHAEKCLALARLKRNVVALCLSLGVPATGIASADEILVNLMLLSEKKAAVDAGPAGEVAVDGEEEEEAAGLRLAEELTHSEAVATAADENGVLASPVCRLPDAWGSMEDLRPECAE